MPSNTVTKNRIDVALSSSSPGLWPFLAAGDPDLKTTEDILLRLGDLPIRGVELGFPFSDPVADGPVIQAAFNRALEGGIRIAQIFEMIRGVRQHVSYPILAMVSASIVYRMGVESFVQTAAGSGFDGLIIPDLSLEEAPAVADSATRHNLRLAMLISPTTPPDRQVKISMVASGFLYYVSVQGITGSRDSLPPDLAKNVSEIRAATGLPVLVGFGISTSEHVRQVCSFANGAIVGSAIVRQIADLSMGSKDRNSIVEGTAGFIRSLASSA